MHHLMAHIVRYSANMEEKHLRFIQRPRLRKIMQFGADADIYKMKFW